jgi:hypothetical protein
LLIGAAVLALGAAPLIAQGNGHGKGQGSGGGKAEHGPAMHGPSMKGPSMKGPSMKGEAHGKSGHTAPSMAPAMKPGASQHASGKAHEPGHGAGQAKAAVRDAGEHGRSAAHPGKPGPRDSSAGNGKANRGNERAANRTGPGIRVLDDGRRYYSERGARETFDFAAARRGPIDGCPPGLAKKYNGCQPPGLAKQRAYRPDWWGLNGIADGRYSYGDGYLLRLNGSRVASYIPLLGGALSPGNIWPSAYPSLPVPEYYADYYDLGPPDSYRYADNVLYRVDPSTSAITSIAGLLTGDNFQIGSPLPPGYDVYNVPYAYRDRYLDGPDARYRYSDGYIYQVDPTTQLVTAAIDLLTGGGAQL